MQSKWPADEIEEAEIDKHLAQFLGDSATVMHSFLAQTTGNPHVYRYPASAERPYQTLVTMGLSSFRMPVPDTVEDGEDLCHVELLTYLPASWPVPSSNAAPGYWPYAMLMSLASYARSANTWLGPLHTIPNLASDPFGQPFEEGSLLSHCLLLDPVQEDEAFDSLEVKGKKIKFLHVLPITTQECQVKVEKGFFDSLAPLLDDGLIPVVIDPKRMSAC